MILYVQLEQRSIAVITIDFIPLLHRHICKQLCNDLLWRIINENVIGVHVGYNQIERTM